MPLLSDYINQAYSEGLFSDPSQWGNFTAGAGGSGGLQFGGVGPAQGQGFQMGGYDFLAPDAGSGGSTWNIMPESGISTPGSTYYDYTPGQDTAPFAQQTIDGGGFEPIDLAPLAVMGLGMSGVLGGMDAGGAAADASLGVQGDSINALEGQLGAGGTGMDQAGIDSLFSQGGDASGVASGLGGAAGATPGLGGMATPLTQLLGGILGLNSAQKGAGISNDILQKLLNPPDPLASSRAGYASQLQNMMNNPQGTVATNPSYQAGMDAVSRSMAANGYLGSGNMMNAMEQYGGNLWNQQAQFLSSLAGYQFAPPQMQGGAAVGAGQLAGQAQATNNNAIMSLVKGGMGLMGPIMSNLGQGMDMSSGSGSMISDLAGGG